MYLNQKANRNLLALDCCHAAPTLNKFFAGHLQSALSL